MIGVVIMAIGAVVCAIGAIGLLRFPDVYTRTHAQTVINVGGTCLILLGAFAETFWSIASIKSMLIIVFVLLTSPIGSHAIARAAYKSGITPKVMEIDELRFPDKSPKKVFKANKKKS